MSTTETVKQFDEKGQPFRASQQYKMSKKWEDVPLITVTRIRRLKGAHMGILKHMGIRMEDATDQQVAQYIVDNYKRKESKRRAIRREKAPRQAQREFAGRKLPRAQRIQRYRDVYDLRTPNDEAALATLVQLETVLEKLEESEEELVEKLASGRATADMVNAVVNAKTKYSTEYRQLQDSLGIDRVSREKKEKEQGGADYMRDLIRQSKALLDEHAKPITCPKCAEKGTLLAMGFVLCHFPDWSFRVKCPRCGSEILLDG